MRTERQYYLAHQGTNSTRTLTFPFILHWLEGIKKKKKRGTWYLGTFAFLLPFKAYSNKQYLSQTVNVLLKCVMKRTPRSTLASSPTLSSPLLRLFTIIHLNFRAQLLETSVPAEYETTSAGFPAYKAWDFSNHSSSFDHLK